MRRGECRVHRRVKNRKRKSVWKLGSVTDLASVCLRSVSPRLKPNTLSCSALLHVYSSSEALFIKAPDADDVNRHRRCSFHVKMELQINESDRCPKADVPIAPGKCFPTFSHQCYRVTRRVRAEIWLRPFTLPNVHCIKTDG